MSTAPAGWHGKLPTLGDFATRRLPPDVVQAWDEWLSEGLAALQQQAGWLDAYLASPSWRFLLMPGVLPGAAGDSAWAGVLMPSVDRVGRYYPLTIAQPLAALPATEHVVDALWSWLLRIDEAAADALHDDWSVELLEAELARIGAAPVEPVGGAPVRRELAPGIDELPLNGQRHAGTALAAQARDQWLAAARGQAFWAADADLTAPRLLRSQGLAPALLPRLLGSVDDNRASPGATP